MNKETMERARGICNVINHLASQSHDNALSVDCTFIRIGYLVEAGKSLMRQAEVIDHLNEKVETLQMERKADVGQ